MAYKIKQAKKWLKLRVFPFKKKPFMIIEEGKKEKIMLE